MTTDNRPSLARPDVAALPLYGPDAAPCAIDLSDNTNLWGAPPVALAALRDVQATAVSRYPSTYSRQLRSALLAYMGIGAHPEMGVVVGCGSDDIIDSAMRAFGAPGDAVAFCAPTFSMIPVFARLNGLVAEHVPSPDDFGLDADRLVECSAKISYVCTPNNPTSTAATRQAVEYVVEHARGLVIIDEAYAEFAPETFASLAERSERVLVTRTFSKAFGMAGLRIGYAAGADATVGLVARARGPYKVNALAERAARAALEPDGVRWVRERAAEVVSIRDRLTSALRGLGFDVLPSAANFVLVPASDSSAIARALRKQGILVRLLTGLPQDTPRLRASGGNALRIGIGPWEMMESLLAALGEVRSCA